MNCKPGDMAVQILSEFPENIGSIVEVIEAKSYGVWLCRCTGEGTCQDIDTGELDTCHAGDICQIDDYKLIPIKGDGLKLKNEEKVV